MTEPYFNLVHAFTNPGQQQIALLLMASSRTRCASVSISISEAEASPRFSIDGNRLRTISGNHFESWIIQCAARENFDVQL